MMLMLLEFLAESNAHSVHPERRSAGHSAPPEEPGHSRINGLPLVVGSCSDGLLAVLR